jgi:hypothetical protein
VPTSRWWRRTRARTCRGTWRPSDHVFVMSSLPAVAFLPVAVGCDRLEAIVPLLDVILPGRGLGSRRRVPVMAMIVHVCTLMVPMVTGRSWRDGLRRGHRHEQPRGGGLEAWVGERLGHSIFPPPRSDPRCLCSLAASPAVQCVGFAQHLGIVTAAPGPGASLDNIRRGRQSIPGSSRFAVPRHNSSSHFGLHAAFSGRRPSRVEVIGCFDGERSHPSRARPDGKFGTPHPETAPQYVRLKLCRASPTIEVEVLLETVYGLACYPQSLRAR